MKEDVKFIDEKITELQESADKRKTDKQISMNAVSKSFIPD